MFACGALPRTPPGGFQRLQLANVGSHHCRGPHRIAGPRAPRPHDPPLGTTAIVDKYRKLLKKTKEARVEQIILAGILPVFGNRIDGYRNSKRMAINGMVKRLCKEEDVGYVDLWDSFVGKEEMYVRDGLHLGGKGLLFLPRDSQGRLPVAWVKYDN